jgi:hypothetical protein
MKDCNFKEIGADQLVETLENLGTEKLPIRASSISMLLNCNWFFIMDNFMTDQGDSVARDTGTAVGRAIELFHDMGSPNLNDCLEGLLDQLEIEALEGPIDREGKRRDPFPAVDFDDLKLWFSAYASDPRNHRDKVAITDQESRFELELDPHDLDPSGKKIIIAGHIDQLRINKATNTKSIWDVKSGKSTGPQMLNDYLYQQLAYYAAYRQTALKVAKDQAEADLINSNFELGGIIRLRDYYFQKKPVKDPQVFYTYKGFSDELVDKVLDSVRLQVALLRQGEVCPTAGTYCNYCPAGGVKECFEKLSIFL